MMYFYKTKTILMKGGPIAEISNGKLNIWVLFGIIDTKNY